MKSLLIIITLILGIIGVISDPIKRKEKIKTVGWIIIFFLFISGILNIIQERQSQNSAQRAGAVIDSLKTNLKLTGENLISARQQLLHQMDINLITVLSQNMRVKSAAIRLDFTGKANEAKSITSYLFSKRFDEMKEIAWGKLTLNPFMGIGSTVQFNYSNDDKLIYLNSSDNPLQTKPVLNSFFSEYFHPEHRPYSIRDTSGVSFHSPSENNDQAFNSAAIAFRDLSDTSRMAAELSIEYKKYYKDMEEIEELEKKYNLHAFNRWGYASNNHNCSVFEMDSVIKEYCVDYWKNCLVKGTVYLYLKNDSYLMFTCRLKIKIDSTDCCSIKVMFYPAAKPEIIVGIIEA